LALQAVFEVNLPQDFARLWLIVQHMLLLLRAFAERLNNICQITVKELKMETVASWSRLLAPGGKQNDD